MRLRSQALKMKRWLFRIFLGSLDQYSGAWCGPHTGGDAEITQKLSMQS